MNGLKFKKIILNAGHTQKNEFVASLNFAIYYDFIDLYVYEFIFYKKWHNDSDKYKVLRNQAFDLLNIDKK